MYLFAISVLFGENSLHVFADVLNELSAFLLLSSRVLFILYILVLCLDMWLANIFSQSVAFLSSSYQGLLQSKIFNSDEAQFINFFVLYRSYFWCQV